MSLPCIFCKRMHLQYIGAFLVSTPWGFAPNPSLTCGAAGQAVKTQPPDPVVKCWVGSKASRVKCTASPPLTPLHLRESSKTIRSGRSWKPVKACEATACGSLYRLEATQRSVVRVQEVFPCTCHVANAGVGSAHGVNKTLGGSRSRGQCAVGTHFKGFGVLGLQGTEPALCSLAWLSGDRWAHVASVAKAAPCALRPLIT